MSNSKSPPTGVIALVIVAEFGLSVLIKDQVLQTRLSLLGAAFLASNVALWAFWIVIVYPYFRSPLRHLPRPKGEWPFIGQGIAPYCKPVGHLYLKWMTEVPNDGLITYRSIFNGDRLLITSPQAIAEVLVHNSYCYEKPAEERAIIGRFLGDSLTIVEGDVHRAQRKLMTPVYALKNIKALYPIFWSKAHQLVDKVAMRIKNGNVPHGATAKNCGPSTVQEITLWANKTTLDIIGLAGLGKDFGNLEDTKNDLFEVYQEVFQYALAKDIFMAVNRTLPTKFVQSLPWGINDRINATTVLLGQVCQTLVDEKLSKFEKNEGKLGMSKDIMSLLIRASDWGPRQLVEQLLTFVAAGHETSASSFTWACCLLSENQQTQRKLYNELTADLATVGTNPSAAELASLLESLPYLNAVCNETLRFFPPVPVIRRTCNTPTAIHGVPISPGTRIILSPWATNRKPALWGADADVFKLERWINQDTGKANNHGGMQSNYANLTFSHGPRSCIGQNFAKAELRSLVAVWCSRFGFEKASVEAIVSVGIVSVRPRDGLNLRVWERDSERMADTDPNN